MTLRISKKTIIRIVIAVLVIGGLFTFSHYAFAQQTCQVGALNGNVCGGVNDIECQYQLKCVDGTCRVGALNGNVCGGVNDIECQYQLKCVCTNGDCDDGGGVIIDPGDPGGATVTLELAERVARLYNFALAIGGALALGLIIFCGVKYSASGGNPSTMKDAKECVLAAIFGFILLLASFVILDIINPDLTFLEDPLFITNPRPPAEYASVPISELPEFGGEGGMRDCDGRYTFGLDGNSPRGNFGDPNCDFNKNDLYDLIRVNAASAGLPPRVVDIFFYDVVSCESSYNPNAVNLSQNVPQKTGAWGLFQMGLAKSPERPNPGKFDEGSVVWTLQTFNAMNRHRITEPSPPNKRSVYWSCWPKNLGWNGLPRI